MVLLPIDVQMKMPDVKIPLSRVGVTNVRKLLRVPRKNKRPIILLANFQLNVDLPSSQKGIHMSRNLEAVNEIIEEATQGPIYLLEDICADIVKKVITKHDYATRSEVFMESKLMVPRATPSGGRSQDFVKLIATAQAYRSPGGEIRLETEVGAEINGLIMDPHESDLKCAKKATASIKVMVPAGYHIKINDLLQILDASMSSRTYGSLGKEDVEKVMTVACTTPRGVGDVLESILKGAKEKFLDLPGDTFIQASCVSMEPLYNYETLGIKTAAIGSIE